MGFIDTEDYLEKLDIEIRTWLEENEMPQWFVNELAKKYLNVTYIRKRIKKIYPEFIREIAPLIELH